MKRDDENALDGSFLLSALPRKCAMASLSALIEGLRLSSPILMGVLTDRLVGRSDWRAICLFACLLFFAEGLTTLFSYVKSVVEIKSFASLNRNVFERYWRSVSQCRLSVFFNDSQGVWRERLTHDVHTVVQAVRHVFCGVFGVGVFFLGNCLFVFRGNWRLYLIFLVAIAVGALTYLCFKKKILAAAEKSRRGCYAMSETLHGVLRLHPLLSVHGRIGRYRESLRNAMAHTTLRDARLWIVFAQNTFFLDLMSWIVRIGMFAICICDVVRGVMTPGELIALLICVDRLLQGVSNAMQLFPEVVAGFDALQAMRSSLQPREEACGAAHEASSCSREERDWAVRCSGVSFRYGNGRALFSDFSMTLGKSDVCVFLGRNGIGKSTLSKLLLGVLDPSCGTVERNVDRIGWIPQDAGMLNDSVLENVRLRDEGISPSAVEQAVRTCGISDWVDSLPHGLFTRVSPCGVSGGQLQLLSIARALVRDPDFIVVDEISNNLDIVMRQKVYDVLGACAKGRCVVLISHDVESVRLANRLFFFGKDGIEELPKGTTEDDVRRKMAQ